MIDMSEIFDDDELTQIITLYPSTTTKSGGDIVSELGEPVDLLTITHPTKPDDLKLLPEGERYLPSIKIMSPDEFKQGDQVFHKGSFWRVAALSSWEEYGFYNGIAVKHEGTQAATAKAFELK